MYDYEKDKKIEILRLQSGSRRQVADRHHHHQPTTRQQRHFSPHTYIQDAHTAYMYINNHVHPTSRSSATPPPCQIEPPHEKRRVTIMYYGVIHRYISAPAARGGARAAAPDPAAAALPGCVSLPDRAWHLSIELCGIKGWKWMISSSSSVGSSSSGSSPPRPPPTHPPRHAMPAGSSAPPASRASMVVAAVEHRPAHRTPRQRPPPHAGFPSNITDIYRCGPDRQYTEHIPPAMPCAFT